MLLRTLGGLTLEGADFHRPKPLLLLAYLAVEGPVERRYLAELLWMRAANPRRSLAMALSQLRSADPALVASDDVRVWSPVACDVTALLAADAERDWARVVELARGDFLDGTDASAEGVELEEWVVRTREELGRRVRHAVLSLGERGVRAGRPDEAAVWIDRARALLRDADAEPEEAARLYTLAVAAGRSTIGIGASEDDDELRELELPATRADALAAIHAADSESRPRGVPRRATPFVGRHAELEALARRLDDPATRLVSIVGLGGVGKTRLAIALADAWAARHPGAAVAFVPLDEQHDAAQVPGAVARATGLPAVERGDAMPAIRHALAGRPWLIVLDNVEHVLDAAPFVAELAGTHEDVRLVATTRARLDIEDEFVYMLHGLATPGRRARSLQAALEADAVALFVDRARRARADFEATDRDVPALLRICDVVGGMPLALELAADWARLLTCEEIAHELQRSLDLLASSRVDLPERHRSVRAAFDGSWRRSTADEQRVMRTLAVFQGGCALRSALAVAEATLDQLGSLVDRALVAWDGAGRYRIHPLLREFVLEKAAADPEALARARDAHAAHFLGMLAAWSDAFPHRDSGRAKQAIEPELGNALAAWEWAAQHGHHGLMEAAADALAWFLFTSGRSHRGLTWATRPTRADPDSLLGVRLAMWHGKFLMDLGRHDASVPILEAMVARAERLGALREVARGLRNLGLAYEGMRPADVPRLRAAFERAREVYAAVGDAEGAAMMLNNLAHYDARPDASVARLRRAMAEARAAGETHAVGMVAWSLAAVHLHGTGDYPVAMRAAVEAERSHEATGFDVMIAGAAFTRAQIALALGEVADAESAATRMLAFAEKWEQEVAAPFLAGAYAVLGQVAHERGDRDGARGRWRVALEHAQHALHHEHALRAAAMSLCGLARAARDAGAAADAHRYADDALARIRGYAGLGWFGHAFTEVECLVESGDALAATGAVDRGERRMLEGLALAHSAGCTPGVVVAVARLAELLTRFRPVPAASAALAVVASHSAAPAALAARARALLVATEHGGRAEGAAASDPRMQDAATIASSGDLDALVAGFLAGAAGLAHT